MTRENSYCDIIGLRSGFQWGTVIEGNCCGYTRGREPSITCYGNMNARLPQGIVLVRSAKGAVTLLAVCHDAQSSFAMATDQSRSKIRHLGPVRTQRYER